MVVNDFLGYGAGFCVQRPVAAIGVACLGALLGACGGSGGGAGGNTAADAPAAAVATGMPTRDSIVGKPVVGRIVARSGQVIEDLHVVTGSGPCIVVPDGVRGVVIRNAEIGPCGQAGELEANGIEIGPGATEITVQRNVIHDVASGVYVRGGLHPIVIDRNLVYNIRGPFPRGQAVQFNGVSTGTLASRITCNVSDTSSGPWSDVEDHISLFDSPGLPSDRTVIAYNRLRGGSPTSDTGSGIMVGDGQFGGHVWAHHNIVVNVANAGMGIAGGRNVTMEANRIFLDGRSARSRVGLVVQNFQALECRDHALIGNRVWAVDVIEAGGAQNHAHFSSSCPGVLQVDNTLGDPTLGAAMFDDTPAACQ